MEDSDLLEDTAGAIDVDGDTFPLPEPALISSPTITSYVGTILFTCLAVLSLHT